MLIPSYEEFLMSPHLTIEDLHTLAWRLRQMPEGKLIKWAENRRVLGVDLISLISMVRCFNGVIR